MIYVRQYQAWYNAILSLVVVISLVTYFGLEGEYDSFVNGSEPTDITNTHLKSRVPANISVI